MLGTLPRKAQAASARHSTNNTRPPRLLLRSSLRHRKRNLRMRRRQSSRRCHKGSLRSNARGLSRIRSDDKFLSGLQLFLWFDVKDENRLVGARDDGFGYGYELLLLVEDAEPGGLPVAGIQLGGSALGGNGLSRVNLREG